jgi:uncharacterized protein
MKIDRRLKVAVVGSGISGLSAAWLLSQRHDVTLYERAERLGGHSNTVMVTVGERQIPVDMGFIVFNRQTYPNLTALFAFLDVNTQPSDMSFAVSLDEGRFEYAGSLPGLFGQPRNIVRPRFWSMLADLVRFYRQATADGGRLDESLTLGDYLRAGKFGDAFRDHHLLPMASAVWSAAPSEILDYPAASFIRFHTNHGLLQMRRRPMWETVVGGAQSYVSRMMRGYWGRVALDAGVASVMRSEGGVRVTDMRGETEAYDRVVMATHADQTLSVLADASKRERDVLGAFRYSRNLAVLHTDASFMPKRRAVWSSWNYIGTKDVVSDVVSVTYWMNRLQTLPTDQQIFVTLNPGRPPRGGALLHSEVYDHPIFDAPSMAAQRELWSLQGRGNVWFAGAYFGAGFHEDGLQAGLAVAEALGGVRRPWSVANESGRIVCGPRLSEERDSEALT